MQRNLVATLFFAALCSDGCLCRRGGAPGKRNKKTSSSSASKPPTPATAPAAQRNLCYGGQMINSMELYLPEDIQFYKANWKDFPDRLYYPNCSFSLKPNATEEVLIGECVNFTITLSKLSLPDTSKDQRARVMWHVINHLCANEDCHQPCPQSSSARGLWSLRQLLVVSLIGCSVLSAE